ncbi:MAG: CRISPR-associated endonuclease Cas2 [Desulfobacteraceae bacterium]
MMILVSYDVSTTDEDGPRRLRRVAKICKNFGQRVQYSVFECIVDPAQLTRFRQKLIDEIDPEKDSLRFYSLGAGWRNRIEHIGAKASFDQEGPLII